MGVKSEARYPIEDLTQSVARSHVNVTTFEYNYLAGMTRNALKLATKVPDGLQRHDA